MSALDFVGHESNWLGKPVDLAEELQIRPTAEFEVAGRQGEEEAAESSGRTHDGVA
jgi:hypothetical protein